MEGIRWERTVLLSTPTMRTDFFRPMRRAVTDLSLARKRRNKFDSTVRSSRSNQVPVVSVQYDVPRTPPSPVVYRYRRHHTPCTTQSTPQQVQKNKVEDKNNHLANVDNHRLKGLGVGKGYVEFHSPQTAGATERVPPATAPVQDQMNYVNQSLNNTSPLGSRLFGTGHGNEDSGSPDPSSSTRALKGSIHSPSQTSMSQYQQQWSVSQGQTPTSEMRFNKCFIGNNTQVTKDDNIFYR